MTAAGVGLYSIGVRGIDVPELLEWAGAQGVPFAHLRGGPRGYDLARQSPAVLAHWRRCAEVFVPVTGVTADLDVADFFAPSAPERARAREGLECLAATAAVVGAGWVRLLGRAVPRDNCWRRCLSVEVPAARGPPLVELHHPGWLAPSALDALEKLLGRWPRMRVLADTAQLATAMPSAGGHADAAVERCSTSRTCCTCPTTEADWTQPVMSWSLGGPGIESLAARALRLPSSGPANRAPLRRA